MADRILKPDSGNDLVLQNDDGSAKIEINEAGTIVHTGTSSIDVSGGTFTTSSAQKQAIVQAGPGSGTLDVSSGTFTTSSAQKTAIVDGGKGNLTKSDVGLSNVTNDAQVPASGGTFSGNVTVSNLIIGDGANIGSASDTDAISIASNGQVTFSSNTLATHSEVTGTKKDSSITSGTSSLTIASASGISNGDFVVGEGITPGTTVSSGAGTTTLTLSANANANLSSDPVMFYSATKLLSPGLVGGMLCRAWVNFDGTGTVAIRASANVSSITDITDGKYTVNFTTAMEDSNYCVTGAVRKNNTTDDGNMILTLGASDTEYSTTGFRVTTRQSASNGVRNAELVCCAVFR